MRGAIPPLPQYVFMALCLVKHIIKLPLQLSLLILSTKFRQNLLSSFGDETFERMDRYEIWGFHGGEDLRGCIQNFPD
jgi:hypothetical protein